MWDHYTIPLASYTGTGKYVAIPENNNLFEIDNSEIDYSLQCNAPSNIILAVYDDSVGVSWNENNTSYLNWQIAYGYSGFDVQSGDWNYITEAYTNPSGVAGLQPSTSYDLYVRTICSEGDTSAWSQAASFSTYCPMISSLPYTQNFNTPAPPFPPHCWQAVYGNNNLSINPMTYGTPLYGNNTTPSYRSHREIKRQIIIISNPHLVIWSSFQYLGTHNMPDVDIIVVSQTTDDIQHLIGCRCNGNRYSISKLGRYIVVLLLERNISL